MVVFLSSFAPTQGLWAEYRASLPDTIPHHLDWPTTLSMPEPYRTRLKLAKSKWSEKKNKIIETLKLNSFDVPNDLDLAWKRLNTRTVYLNDDSPSSMDSTRNWALVPFLDCLNHSSSACSKTRIRNDRFELITEQRVEKDEQVFISYGQHSDTFLMIEYGFIIGNTNKLNFVDFVPTDIVDNINQQNNPKRVKMDSDGIMRKVREIGCSDGLGVDSTGPTWSLIRFVAVVCLGDVSGFVYDNFSEFLKVSFFETYFTLDSWPADKRSKVKEELKSFLRQKIKDFEQCTVEGVLSSFLTDQIELMNACINEDNWEE